MVKSLPYKENIMSGKKKYIYESPDGGITIRAREFGDNDYKNTITITTADLNSSDPITIQHGNLGDYKPNLSKHPNFDLHEYDEVKKAYDEYLKVEERYKAWNYIKN
jgi:hypothetical protein